MRRAVVLAAAAGLVAGCGGPSASAKVERQLRGDRIPSFGRVTSAHCAKSAGAWTCEVRSGPRRATCALSVAGGRIEGSYCNVRP